MSYLFKRAMLPSMVIVLMGLASCHHPEKEALSRQNDTLEWLMFPGGNPEAGLANYFFLDSVLRVRELNSTVVYQETNTFEPAEGKPLGAFLTTEVSRSGAGSFRTDSTVEFGPGLTRPLNVLPIDTGYMYIRATLNVWPVEPISGNPASLVVSFERDKTPYRYGSLSLGKLDSLVPGRWNRITVRSRVPEEISSEDVLKVYVWHRGKGTLFCDDFQVELIKR